MPHIARHPLPLSQGYPVFIPVWLLISVGIPAFAGTMVTIAVTYIEISEWCYHRRWLRESDERRRGF